jgi:alpha-amylase/alpha-mannosidase (GH57 family)
MAEPLTFVVHGHFYQPPRENPWTEEVTREPSAAPFHDWNARIASECYRPNAFARVVDERGRLVAIVDNYERISFDFGPTLLSWLERHDPPLYRRMVAADEVGHGGMAQGFGHVILPLCNQRDLRTQVRWGLADFEHRFGRRAAGMWLPEAAVNNEVLAVLADEGVRFTVLAPGQAARVRPAGADGDAWQEASNGALDTTRPYRWCHPAGDGRGVDIVFYDGGLSHDIAFGLSSMSSEGLISRAAAAAPEGGLVTVATDGETFGHHHHYGDRLLAYALAVEAPRRDVEVSSVSAYLDTHRPVDEVEIHESSWSCIHGVGRWREDCGCSTGGDPGWNQQWRTPLREALDLLRDHAAEVFDRRGRAVLGGDPWAARDAYVNVVLNAMSREDFATRYITGDWVEGFTLLEAQRHAMAMYTSCGWFFNDLAGLETVQVLRYAARVMDLLAELGEQTMEAPFLDVLQRAHSNRADEGDGIRVWTNHVIPARADVTRVVAHLALAELLEGTPPPPVLANHDIEVLGHEHGERGVVALSSGHVVLTHRRTGRRFDRVYAAVRLGGLEVMGANRPADPRRDDVTIAILRDAFAKGANLGTLISLVSDGFGRHEFGLESALPDGAEQIVQSTATAVADRFAAAMDRLFDDHRLTLEALTALGQPLPAVLQAPAELALARRFEAAVAAQAGSADPRSYAEAVAIARSARANGWKIDTPAALSIIEQVLLAAARRAVAEADDEAVDAALAVVTLIRDLDLHPNWEPAQEVLYQALLEDHEPGLAQLGEALGLAVERLGKL